MLPGILYVILKCQQSNQKGQIFFFFNEKYNQSVCHGCLKQFSGTLLELPTSLICLLQKLWPDLPLFGVSLSFECNCFYFLLLQVSHSALDLLENKPKSEGQEQISKMQTCSKWQPHNQTSKVKCKEQKGEGSLHSLIWWQCEGLLIQTLIVHIAEGCPAESWCFKTTETPHPSCPLVRVDEICCHDKLLVPSLTVAEFLTVASPWRGRRTGLHQTCGQSSRCIRKRDQARLYSLCTNQ